MGDGVGGTGEVLAAVSAPAGLSAGRPHHLLALRVGQVGSEVKAEKSGTGFVLTYFCRPCRNVFAENGWVCIRQCTFSSAVLCFNPPFPRRNAANVSRRD